MKRKMSKSEAGAKGAEATHRRRYEALQELSKLVAKPDLNWIQAKWKTTHILKLLQWLQR